MKKEKWYKNLSKKDWIILGFSILAVIVLFVLLVFSRKEENLKRQQLVEYKDKMDVSGENILIEETNYQNLLISEINQSGYIELYNDERTDCKIGNLTILVNGKQNVIKNLPNSIKAKSVDVIEFEQSFPLEEEFVIAIQDEDEKVIRAACVPALGEKESYGVLDFETMVTGKMTETKGMENGSASLAEEEGLRFSIPGGFYKKELKLSIAANTDEKIYYTLDGSAPTVESMLYSEPIVLKNRSGSQYEFAKLDGSKPTDSIIMGTNVRAISVDAKGNITNEISSTYFIGIGNIVSMRDLPVISITTKPENLFDYFDGMYVEGRAYEDSIASGIADGNHHNYMLGMEKDATIEYYEVSKDCTYRSFVKLKMLESNCVGFAQKGMVATLPEEVNAGTSVNTFVNTDTNTLTLRNYYYDDGYKIRSMLCNQALQDSSVGTLEQQPCTVFIDGEYWGIYCLQMDYNATYVQQKYGVSEDNQVYFVQNGTPIGAGANESLQKMMDFVTSHDMSVKDNYAQACQMMDMESYADYLCANVYLANANAGQDDWCMWRTKESRNEKYEDGKWRFAMGRCEHSVANGVLGDKSTYSINTFMQPQMIRNPLFQAMIRNDQFCELLQNSMKKMYQRFAPETMEEKLNQMEGWLEKPVIASVNRFYGYVGDRFYSSEIEKIQTFFEMREQFVSRYMEELKTYRLTKAQLQQMEQNRSDDLGTVSNVETNESEETVSDESADEQMEEDFLLPQD